VTAAGLPLGSALMNGFTHVIVPYLANKLLCAARAGGGHAWRRARGEAAALPRRVSGTGAGQVPGTGTAQGCWSSCAQVARHPADLGAATAA